MKSADEMVADIDARRQAQAPFLELRAKYERKSVLLNEARAANIKLIKAMRQARKQRDKLYDVLDSAILMLSSLDQATLGWNSLTTPECVATATRLLTELEPEVRP